MTRIMRPPVSYVLLAAAFASAVGLPAERLAAAEAHGSSARASAVDLSLHAAGRPLVHIKTHKTGSTSVHKFFKDAAVANGLPLYFEDGHFERLGCTGLAAQHSLRELLRSSGDKTGTGTGTSPWVVTGHMINARFLLHNDTQYLANQCFGPGWFERVFLNFKATVSPDALVVIAAREPISHYLSALQFFAQPNVYDQQPVDLTPEKLDAILDSPVWSNPFASELGIESHEEAHEFCHAVEHWAQNDIHAICMENMEHDLHEALRLSCPSCTEIPAVEKVMPKGGAGLDVAKEGMRQFLHSSGPDTWKRIRDATLLDHVLYQCLCPELAATESTEARRAL